LGFNLGEPSPSPAVRFLGARSLGTVDSKINATKPNSDKGAARSASERDFQKFFLYYDKKNERDVQRKPPGKTAGQAE